jgi:hypothetical protein
VLLTGKIPLIVDAFRLVPVGRLVGLKTVRFGGEVEVNPKDQDLFRTLIEQRKSLNERKELSEKDVDRLDKSLKVLANATSYGIFAEMNRQESEKRIKVRCHGLDPEPFECSVLHPEQPGEFCFPPLASPICPVFTRPTFEENRIWRLGRVKPPLMNSQEWHRNRMATVYLPA